MKNRGVSSIYLPRTVRTKWAKLTRLLELTEIPVLGQLPNYFPDSGKPNAPRLVQMQPPLGRE
jgi:hypothetical protein